MAALSDYMENILVDVLFRGQVLTLPASLYVGLFQSAGSDVAPGTEVNGGGYARVAVPRTLAAWAGTQAAGSTALSSGSGGQTSNNTDILFPLPTAAWGTVTHFGIFDAASGGNMLIHGPLSASKIINAGDNAPLFPAAALVYTIDN